MANRLGPINSFCAPIALLFLGCSGDDPSQLDAGQDVDASIDAAIDGPLAACDDSFEPKGDRVLGFDILDVPAGGSFENNVAAGKAAGMGFIALHVTWADIETAPSTYTDPGGALKALSDVAFANNLKFSLTIRPIDLTGKTLPADLSTDPMNAHRMNTPLVMDRFTAMMDHVLTEFVDPNVLLNLQIGNEIDGFNTTDEHPDFWSDYGAFLFNNNSFLDTNYPAVSMGFTLTHAGAVAGALRDAGVWTALASVSDHVGITYYPLNKAFGVEDPSVVVADFATLVAEFAASGKPIALQEVGYQSASVGGSSEIQQSEFFCRFFKAWDTHRDVVESALLVRLNDISRTDAETLAIPYGITDEVFIEYLRTLGLRKVEGTTKVAYDRVIEETTKRGF